MKKQQQFIRLVIALVIVWLLLSGMFLPLQLSFGALSIILVCFLSLKMDVLLHRGQPLYFRIRAALLSWFWLMGEILKSNVAVAREILNPSLTIDPVLKAIPVKQKTELGRVAYANSITLTPGTVAIDFVADDRVLVHALHKAELDQLESGTMGERVCRLEPSCDDEVPANDTSANEKTNLGQSS